MHTSTFGDRVRDRREDLNLSQGGLASLCPPYTRAGKTTKRSSTWISNIEQGKNEPSLSDLVAIARILQAPVGWLLTGEETGDTEFVAVMRGIEPDLDERGKQTVIASAQQQAELAKVASDDAVTQSLIDAGFDPEAARRAVEAMRRTATDPGEAAAGA